MKHRWEEMLPHEFVQARDRFPVCYMPYGLAEPHGAYNALGLDWIKAAGIMSRAAQNVGGIVAPASVWHISDMPEFHDNGAGQGWFHDVGIRKSLCSSIPQSLFLQNAMFHLRAIDAAGFKAAFLMTGHGAGDALKWVVEYYLRKTGSPLVAVGLMDFELIDRSLPYRGDHAGMTETSQLMALRPDLVDLTRREAPAELGERFAAGVDFSKHTPSAEIGEQIIASQARRLSEMAQEALSKYSARAEWKAPTINETAAIWARFEQVTSRYWIGSYADYKAGRKFEFPGWQALGE